MLRSTLVGTAAIVVTVALMRTAEASVITSASRAEVNSVASETKFRTKPAALNNAASAGEAGNGHAARRKSDTPAWEDPTESAPFDIYGWKYIFGELADSRQMALILFGPVQGWGVDAAAIGNRDLHLVPLLLYDDFDALIGSITFTATGGDGKLGLLKFRFPDRDRPKNRGETSESSFFGLGPMAFVTAPEPSALIFLGLGCGVAGLLVSARRYFRERNYNRSREYQLFR